MSERTLAFPALRWAAQQYRSMPAAQKVGLSDFIEARLIDAGILTRGSDHRAEIVFALRHARIDPETGQELLDG